MNTTSATYAYSKLNSIQVEMVGCTSAGKSTLVDRIMDATRAEGVDLSLGDDLVLGQLGLRRLKSRKMRAVCVHVAAFGACMATSWRHFQFVIFAFQVLRQAQIPLRQQLNQLRKVLKQLGRYELIRGLGKQGTIIVDEGTLHVAHNLFVHVDGKVNEELIERFAAQVPLPDVVIYVKTREDVLVERTIDRGHPRIPNPTRRSVAGFVRRAVTAFDKLTSHKRIASRTIVIQDGVLVVEPNKLDNPILKNLLKVLRRATQSASPTDTSPHFESAPEIHGASSEDLKCSR